MDPSNFRRARKALLWAAIVSFLGGMLLYAWGQTADANATGVYQASAIEFRDAINLIAVGFWLAFALFWLIHVRRSEADLDEERGAAVAEAWMDRRRLNLLRGRSRRR